MEIIHSPFPDRSLIVLYSLTLTVATHAHSAVSIHRVKKFIRLIVRPKGEAVATVGEDELHPPSMVKTQNFLSSRNQKRSKDTTRKQYLSL